MLYFLYQLFSINLFQYITVRAGTAFFLSFVLTIYLMPRFIKWAKARNASQPIYDLAPKTHQQKSKTPTMGGIVFFSCFVDCHRDMCEDEQSFRFSRAGVYPPIWAYWYER